MTPPVDHLHSSSSSPLTIPDLDTRFRLQLQTVLRLALPAMYADFASQIDVAAMRRRGLASVISFVELTASTTPLAVGAALEIDSETRVCELSGTGPGQPRARVGLEVRFDFRSLPGTGDPKRYRDTVAGAEPVSCGGARLLLTLIRPFAPAAERAVGEVPEELAHLAAHTLTTPHPGPDDLARVSDDFSPRDPTDASQGGGVWGLHHTDVNQHVFTGAYVAVLEDLATRLVHAAGVPAAHHRLHRVCALFRRPFAAGDAFHTRGRLYARGHDTASVTSIHTLDADGTPFQHPAVLGRLEGRVIEPAATS